MTKLGIGIKIDVTKIDKSKLYKGNKGTYLDLTTFIDTENPSQFGDHGFISQSTTKEEKQNGVQMPILGNSKVFWQGESQQQQGNYNQNQGQQPQNQNMMGDNDLPF